jgi:hypothetical protein
MKEVWASGSRPKISRTSEVSGSVRTEDRSDSGRDRLCMGMHTAKHDVLKELRSACTAAGNLACERVLRSSFTMSDNTSADIDFRCEQIVPNEGVEFPPCALAGDTEVKPSNAVRVALSRIDAE